MAARTTAGDSETVAAAASTSSATLVAGLAEPARLRGIALVGSSTGAGSVVFRDGSSTGTIRLTLHTPAAAATQNVLVPGGGVVFSSAIYAGLTGIDGVTAFYST
jgi:hypothetical protein